MREDILSILAKDALTPHETIAKMLAKSVAEVKAEIAAMEADGVILKYVAVVNTEKLESEPAEAVIELKVTPQRDLGYDEIAKRVYKFPEVSAVYLMSGTYDLHVKVSAPSMKDISKFVWEKLAVMDGISSTVTLFIMRKYKQNGVVLVSDESESRLVITP